jgi:polysaccharide export outer membrane protein
MERRSWTGAKAPLFSRLNSARLKAAPFQSESESASKRFGSGMEFDGGESMRKRNVMRVAVVALAILTWGIPAQSALGQSDDAGKNSGTPADYVIGADDTLRISVWKEPDLSESLPVRPDGKISMPLLNDIPAAGLTPLQLRDSITDKLKKYVADPRVTVVVTAMNSQRVFVTGEVVHSGPIALLPHMTMLQVLGQAGFTQFANVKGIYVLRTENGKQVKLPFNYKEVVKGNHPEQNIALKPGDTVVVP